MTLEGFAEVDYPDRQTEFPCKFTTFCQHIVLFSGVTVLFRSERCPFSVTLSDRAKRQTTVDRGLKRKSVLEGGVRVRGVPVKQSREQGHDQMLTKCRAMEEPPTCPDECEHYQARSWPSLGTSIRLSISGSDKYHGSVHLQYQFLHTHPTGWLASFDALRLVPLFDSLRDPVADVLHALGTMSRPALPPPIPSQDTTLSGRLAPFCASTRRCCIGPFHDAQLHQRCIFAHRKYLPGLTSHALLRLFEILYACVVVAAQAAACWARTWASNSGYWMTSVRGIHDVERQALAGVVLDKRLDLPIARPHRDGS